MRQTDSTELETDRDRRRRRDRHRQRHKQRQRQTDRQRQTENLKTLLLKDSSVRSIWTFLIQRETDRQTEYVCGV